MDLKQAVVQDSRDNKVLRVGYVNGEALSKMEESGEVFLYDDVYGSSGYEQDCQPCDCGGSSGKAAAAQNPENLFLPDLGRGSVSAALPGGI